MLAELQFREFDENDYELLRELDEMANNSGNTTSYNFEYKLPMYK